MTATAPVITASYDPDTDKTQATLELQLSTQALTLEIVSSTEQVDAATLEVIEGGISSPNDPIIINGANGPLVGANVTLDGVVTRKTNEAGEVTFDPELLTPGIHVFEASLEGYGTVIFERLY